MVKILFMAGGILKIQLIPEFTNCCIKFQFAVLICFLFVVHLSLPLLYIRGMIRIREKETKEDWHLIKENFYKSLHGPFDGTWDELAHEHAQLWGFYVDDQLIGYCSKYEQDTLINFFVDKNHSHLKNELFVRALYVLETAQAIVCTNNTGFLTLSLEKSRNMKVHAYLFEHVHDIRLPQPAAINGSQPVLVSMQELNTLLDFCVANTQSQFDRMENYLKRLIERQEIFLLKKEGKIIASCEIRDSRSQPGISDIGVIVDKDHRQKGIGSWLMAFAKQLSATRGNTPICSCLQSNTASRKMIENAGFSPTNMMLNISF